MIHDFIDTVQSGKKQFIDTFIPHYGLREVMHDFVDAQTAYTKAAVDTGMLTAGKMSSLFMFPTSK